MKGSRLGEYSVVDFAGAVSWTHPLELCDPMN